MYLVLFDEIYSILERNKVILRIKFGDLHINNL